MLCDQTPEVGHELRRKTRAKWDADAVRDDLRGYVIDAFADLGAVLVVDETGDLKKGEQSVGVQRQYTGTAGRIENAQVAVFLTYAARRGHALIDRSLYLPRSWTEDEQRRRQAGVPGEVEFATKPALATAMISRAVQAGTPAAWVAGDEVYGADPNLHRTVREHGLGYVLQVAANRRVPTQSGPMRVDAIPAPIPASGWQTYSCGRGSKGHRDYSWAWIELLPGPGEQLGADEHGRYHLLIRRNSATGETGLPALLHPTPDLPGHPGAGGRATLAHRGILPNSQRPHRRGPAPSAALDLLAPLEHPRHARARLPRRRHRHRTPPRADTGRADRADRQRVPPSLRRHPARRPTHHRDTPGLVHLAPTTPSPSRECHYRRRESQQ